MTKSQNLRSISSVSIVLIMAALLLTDYGEVFSESNITIRRVHGNIAVINKGSQDGLKVGDRFAVVRTTASGVINIATVEVSILRDNLASIKVVETFGRMSLMAGDNLVQVSRAQDTVQSGPGADVPPGTRDSSRVEKFQKPYTYPGLHEIGLTSGITALAAQGTIQTNILINALYGYFLNSIFELGTISGIQKLEGRDAFGALTGFVSAHLSNPRSSPAVPFLAVKIGVGLESKTSQFVSGILAGVKVFNKSGGGAFVVQYFYQRQTSQGFGANSFGLELGISLLL